MTALPKRPRGRQSAEAEAKYQAEVKAFCETILQIASTLNFKVSARGWCYILENAGTLTKGEFDTAQKLITECRKSGLLPLDICLEDSAREFSHIEHTDNPNIDTHANNILYTIGRFVSDYQPVSFWDDKSVYIQMMVEKIDLRSLFSDICERFYIPLANARGWSDLNSRAEMMRRFREHEEAGRQCVLLYCGDHDPGGLSISGFLRSNMAELANAVGWSPENLIIDRFGLNYDFIVSNRLSWIENLETGSGQRLDDPKHKDHNKSYVQDYIAKYRARKVEANALVVNPVAGRKLCLDSILRWLGDEDAPTIFEGSLAPYRDSLAKSVTSMISDGWEVER